MKTSISTHWLSPSTRVWALIGASWFLIHMPMAHSHPINLTYAATPMERVLINNTAGSVTVYGWKRNAVHVSGTLGAGSERLAVHARKGWIRIRVVLPEYAMNVRGTHLVVDVPIASRLVVKTVSAEIQASGLAGVAHLKSVSGNVLLQSQSHVITVKSVSGTVRIAGSAPLARIRAQTVSGGVSFQAIRGWVRASSVSGSIQASDHLRMTRALLHSTSGNVRFDGPVLSQGRYVLTSVSGDIDVLLSPHPDARFYVSTLSGSIRNNFGPSARRQSAYGPGRILDFVSGKHGASVKIHTLSGDITLRAR